MALARLSYFVGMVCPGLHSVFSSLNVSVTPDISNSQLQLQLSRYDDRVGLFHVSIAGPLCGELRAFLRPRPAAQPTCLDLLTTVSPAEFVGTSSLIIGGSRGLGELCAKILATGGGRVSLTYSTGESDARRVCDEINACARGRAEMRHWDVQTGVGSVDIDWSGLNSVFYFATPRIYRKKSQLFDSELFLEFCRFYLIAFQELCDVLDSVSGSRRCTVLLPSSEFVNERPRGLTEYAMCKAAAEILADDFNRTSNRVKVICARLPRLDTDQTTSVLPIPVAASIPTLLPVVRAVISGSRHALG